MNKELEGGDRGSIYCRYYPGIFLDGLRKTSKTLSQDSRSLGRNLDPGPPEYEAGVLTTRQQGSVPPCIVRMVKSRRLRLGGQVTWLGWERRTFQCFSWEASWDTYSWKTEKKMET
jgi:hypothetical protein